MLLRYAAAVLITVLSFSGIHAQLCNTLNIQEQYDLPSVCGRQTMTMQHDRYGAPLLYVALKEGGLVTYNLSGTAVPIDTVDTSRLNGLHVMNVHQEANFLYLSLGNHFAFGKQNSGMAIVDVSNPYNAIVTDIWEYPQIAGAGIIKVEGDFAYLGAMANGVFIFNIADKYNIQQLSHFEPDLSFPETPIDTPKYNARGMEVRNSIIYLCHDAGGIRIINAEDKTNPVETGRYSNPMLLGKPRAYNNLILDDTLLYVAIDYCGMEVLSIKDTGNIYQVAWWNPWNCPAQVISDWSQSPGHTNEIAYNKSCQLLFMSSGKGDLHVVDVSDPTQPDSCNFFGGGSNNIGTWGVSLYKDTIFLSYICTPVPFVSLSTMVKVLTYDNSNCVFSQDEPVEALKPEIYPNPASTHFQLNLPEGILDWKVSLFTLEGKKLKQIYNQNYIDVSGFSPGIYIVEITAGEQSFMQKLVIHR